MKHTLLAALALIVLGTGSALASEKCTTPRNEWQSRETLEKKLTAEGWKVKRIKVDDGCYEVYGFAPDGRRIEAYFNPKSLATVRQKMED
ncbi:MAG: PepSY domain-containing protein [Alphaproteobacteria bacterium]|nr:MAG: PepSY domain-containing protein [Alphaproteobacteria bacterium]